MASDLNMIRTQRHAVAGYAARFDVLSPHHGKRERIRPGAFQRALVSGSWCLLLNHQNHADHGALSLGSMSRGTLHVEEDPVGLWFEAALSDDADGDRFMRMIRLGQVTGVSTGGGGPDYWRSSDGVDVLVESHPWEISLITAPTKPARQGTWCKPLAEALPLKGNALLERWKP